MANADTIRSVRWHCYRVPLRGGFTTAHGTLADRAGAIVEVDTTGGITGVGEVAPLPSFAGETLANALATLATLAEMARGRTLPDALALLSLLAQGTNTARYGLETALLDIQGQLAQRSIADLLAPADIAPRRAVGVNAVIGAAPIGETVERALQAVADGYSCLKLKVLDRADVERVAAVRAAVGPRVHLRLDANEAWDAPQARIMLDLLRPLDLQYIEQPLRANDLAGARKLRAETGVAIAADEALSDLASARRVLAARAADVLIVKPQLAGGLRAGRAIVSVAAEHGVDCVVTGTIETGIGVGAALHLAAARPEITLECGLATLSLLEDDLVRADMAIHNGVINLPTGAGLGIALDRDALARYRAE